MYTLIMIKKDFGNFATIKKDGKEIEPLSGLYMAGPGEIAELDELVRLANTSRPTPTQGNACRACGHPLIDHFCENPGCSLFMRS
jgi:hypothetical protein